MTAHILLGGLTETSPYCRRIRRLRRQTRPKQAHKPALLRSVPAPNPSVLPPTSSDHSEREHSPKVRRPPMSIPRDQPTPSALHDMEPILLIREETKRFRSWTPDASRRFHPSPRSRPHRARHISPTASFHS